jgi:hypothetical protein
VNRSQATDEADEQDDQGQREQSEGAWVRVRGCPQGLRDEALPELPFVIYGRQRDLIPVQPTRPAGRRELARVAAARRAACRRITLLETANSIHPGTEATFGREAGVVGRRRLPTSRGLASRSARVGRSAAARVAANAALAVALTASAAAFVIVAAATVAAAFVIVASATAAAFVIVAAATAAAFVIVAAATAAAFVVVAAAFVVVVVVAALVVVAAAFVAVVVAALVVVAFVVVVLVFLVLFVLVRIFGRLRDRSTRSDGRQRRWTGRRNGESEKEKKDPEPHLSSPCPDGQADPTIIPAPRR